MRFFSLGESRIVEKWSDSTITFCAARWAAVRVASSAGPTVTVLACRLKSVRSNPNRSTAAPKAPGTPMVGADAAAVAVGAAGLSSRVCRLPAASPGCASATSGLPNALTDAAS